MCIYCGTTKYRKIYENHIGPIPQDDEGRTYEIHHKDGNNKNNHPDNLVALSIQEHYDIHYKQGDWGACAFIAQYRLNHTKEDISKLVSRANLAKVAKGTHPFMRRADGTSIASDRMKDGTNPFLTINAEKMKDGTHYFLSEEHSKKSRSRQLSLIENGTHNFLVEKECPHCQYKGQSVIMARWHFDNCKMSPNYVPKPKRKYKKRKNQTT